MVEEEVEMIHEAEEEDGVLTCMKTNVFKIARKNPLQSALI